MKIPLSAERKRSLCASLGSTAMMVLFLFCIVYLSRMHVYVFSNPTGPVIVWNDQEAHVFLQRETAFIALRPLKLLATAPAGIFAPPVPYGELRRDLYIARLTRTGVDTARRFRDVDYRFGGWVLKRGLIFGRTHTLADENEWQPFWWNGTTMQPYTKEEVAEMEADFDIPAYVQMGSGKYYGWKAAGYGRHPFSREPADGETTSITMGNTVYKLRFESTKHHVSIFSYHKGKTLTIYVSGGGLKGEQVLLTAPAEVRKVRASDIPTIAGAIARDISEHEEKALGVRIEQRHRPLERWTAKPLQEF